MNTRTWLWGFWCAWAGCLMACPAAQPRHKADNTATSPHKASSRLPIWHRLTAFEEATVKRLARRATPRDLLQLSLIYSGHRQASTAGPFVRRYRAFVDKIRPKIAKQPDVKARGKALLRLFHTGLLGTHPKTLRTRYKLHQTRIDTLLQTGVFNCLSASIVFGVLAQEFGFRADMALMPTHVFIELRHARLKGFLAIETTSPLGFDIKHSRKYYEGAQRQWAIARGLRPATYEEFVQRSRHSILHIICRMALWKHLPRTFPQRKDQRRIREISGYLDPYVSIQHNRLATWINTFQELHKAKDYAQGWRFYAVIGGALRGLSAKHGGTGRLQRYLLQLHLYWLEMAYRRGKPRQEAALVSQMERMLQRGQGVLSGHLAQHLHWLLGQTLDRLARSGKKQRGLQWLGYARRLFPPRTREYESIFWNHYGNALLSQRKWKLAREAYVQCLRRTRPKPSPLCKRNLRAATHNQIASLQHKATEHARARRFSPAIDLYRRCVQQARGLPTLQRACTQNMAATYYNWAVSLYQAGNRAQAKKRLAACLQRAPGFSLCQKLDQQLK